MFIISLCLLLVTSETLINCEEELTTIQIQTNNTQIETTTIEPVQQPTAQSQQIERITLKNESNPIKTTKSDFRPSPHLETYYEFNKVPVPPAFPEAKHHHSLFAGNSQTNWPGKYPTTEQPWLVKFPAPSVPTTKERPYNFYGEKQKLLPAKSDHLYPTKATLNHHYHSTKPMVPQAIHKSHHNFDFNVPVAVEKPIAYGVSGYGDGLDYSEKPHRHELIDHGNPWKTIIKILTTFIPIGLLISALTPTVITVTSVNGTQTRSRAEDSFKQGVNEKFINSLNYFNKLNSEGCEDRILCELLVSASGSKNAEQHIANILDTFTEDRRAVERSEDIKRVFEAVSKQDCRPISCKKINEDKYGL